MLMLPAFRKEYNKAKSLHDRHKFTESLKVLGAVYEQILLCGDKKLTAETIALTGYNNFYLGSYELCLKQFAEAGVLFKELNMMEELATIETSHGATYRRFGLYSLSLFKNLEALTYAFQTPGEYVVASILLNVSCSLYDLGHTGKAFRALDTAILICEKHAGNEKYEMAKMLSLNNKANFMGMQKRFDEMLELLEGSRTIADRYAHISWRNLIESNIAQCLMKLDRHEEAYRILQDVIKKRKNLPDDHHMTNLMKMGVIHKEYLHDDAQFLEYFDKALKLAEKKKMIYRQILIYNNLKSHYLQAGDTGQVQRIGKRLEDLERQDAMNKQTGGIEKLFDASLLAVENKLNEEKQKPGLLHRYDYLTGVYSYTQRKITRHVPFRDIAFGEIRDNYLYLHTFTKDSSGRWVLDSGHRIRKTMKDFITEIGDAGVFFAKTHNSFLVNMAWLSGDSLKGHVLYIGEKEIKVSDTYRSSFKSSLNNFLEREIGLPEQ
jgi:DNA-binding LytR/AlgR family response regulator/predicted nucleic acid-binding protein